MTGKPPLDPLNRKVPAAPPVPAPTRPFPRAHTIPLPGHGAEDVIADDEGRVLCGLEDGRVVRHDPHHDRTEVVVNTGGRPMGFEWAPDGRLIVCDTKRGLLMLELSSGEIETLVRAIDGQPLRFCSNAAIERDGTIWFTESTNRFDFDTYTGSFLEHRPSGRLFRRDANGAVDVVLTDLYFANGLTLTPDGDSLLLAETADYSISRIRLSGASQGRKETLLENLPGFPDNISSFSNGRCWVAMTNPRNYMLDRLADSPAWLRHLIWMLPEASRTARRITWAIALDANGQIVEDLHDKRRDFHMATGAAETQGKLYLCSIEESALLCVEL
ncbi:MAG: SMP-30/gluconolactonase/LRE family protein [Actinomycetota bacterium]|nr:SMP-30/gluconolactonase/LRE family protein [Actinomycetota bacterium]